MRKIIKVLGVPFDDLSMEEAANQIIEAMENGEKKIVCTVNPEIIMKAREDLELMEILKSADMVTADGIGVIWAAKFLGTPLKERIAGYDLCQNIMARIKDTGHTIYFFGAAPGTAEEAAKKMAKEHKGLTVVGTRNGYFTEKDEREIVSAIRIASPDLLLVGLGAPKQEKWIYENFNNTNAKVSIGVGGSFDVMSGNINRAPMIFRRLNLEWFYRLISDPKRAFRMLALPKFVIEVIKFKAKG